jgi:PKD repeat protein
VNRQDYSHSTKLNSLIITLTAFLLIFGNNAYAQTCIADFYADQTSGCAPLTVNFTDNSTQTAVAWTWTFTGGTPLDAKGQGPHQVTYNNPGSYNVSLTIICQQGGDTKTIDKYIKVSDCTCLADFQVDQTSGCAPLTVKFSDASQNATGWNWSFPGGSPSSAQGEGPHYVTYNNTGYYDVTLDATCVNGNDSETKTKLITINDCKCEADFYADQTTGCAPLIVWFADNSENATDWSWNFPGGTPSNAQGKGPHQVVYENPGNHNVTLDITCPFSNDSKTRNNYIQVNDCVCVADFLADQTSGCFPLTVKFTDNSENATSWSWTFEGGSPATAEGQGPHYVTYYNPATRDVSLNVTCAHGSDSATKSDYIKINDCTCEADFKGEPTSGAVPLTVTFTDLSQNATSWDWKFPGGEPSSAQGKGPHTVTYNDTGSYNASLEISCPHNSDTIAKDNYIWAQPVVFLYDFGDAPFPYNTKMADNGAYHIINPDIFLGQGVDADPDGQPDENALGDDNDGNDDEDGVIFPDSLAIGDSCIIQVTASVPGYLSAWIDLNQDGEWDNEADMVLNTQAAAGSNEFQIIIPEDAKPGSTFARFRFCEGGSIPDPHHEMTDGEVEDYMLMLYVFPEDAFLYEYGDAPDGVIAYPAQWVEHSSVDIIGHFPTCGPDHYIRHRKRNEDERVSFGFVDYEAGGNVEDCSFTLYNRDELVEDLPFCLSDDDARLWGTLVSQIKYKRISPLMPYFFPYIKYAGAVGRWGGMDHALYTCQVGRWGVGGNFNIRINFPEGGGESLYINVLVDWNQNGRWCDSFEMLSCDDESPPYLDEYLLQDFLIITPLYVEDIDLGHFEPSNFRIGPNPGYVWARFTITETPIGIENWDGSGFFSNGETEDYLLYVADPGDRQHRDYGDAPDGILAYPSSGVIGNFPTCGPEPAESITHGNAEGRFDMYLSQDRRIPTIELSGNRGYCGVLWNMDDDDGLRDAIFDWSELITYTIEGSPGSETIVREFPRCESHDVEDEKASIGRPCQIGRWGEIINFHWVNNTDRERDAYINVLIDWNQNGRWGGLVACGSGLGEADEHVLKNFRTNRSPHNGFLSFDDSELPPDFRFGPNEGYLWARFTISETPVPIPWNGSGSFSDGETEDHLLLVQRDNLDFGDAPSENYPTLDADDGAAHRIVTDFCLGKYVDAEPDGLPDREAQGDDNLGEDDEDGVEFINSLVPGEEAKLVVTASTNGILNAWMDFNADSRWHPDDEHIFIDYSLDEGENLLTFIVPEDANTSKSIYARLRFSDVGGLPPYGWPPAFLGREAGTWRLPIGEVEDYCVRIEDDGELKRDYGDAPSPYKTKMADSGAYHIINPDIFLGQGVDADPDGQPDENALGDDNDGNDDEDGVIFPDSLFIGDSCFVQVTASVPGYLSAWIDLNQDGEWDNEADMVLNTQAAAGTNEFQITIPEDAKPGSTFARVRFCEGGSIPDPYDEVINGEVEDYMLVLGELPPFLYEFGDAPDGVLAYPAQWVEHSSVDIIGHFPTCGPEHYIRHGKRNEDERVSFNYVDFETGGNAGDCSFELYNQDELVCDIRIEGICNYNDHGLGASMIYQITYIESAPGIDDVPVINYAGGDPRFNPLYTCQLGSWGDQLAIWIKFYGTDLEDSAYVNVLFDWNQDGRWCGGGEILSCHDESPPHLHEHVLRDFLVHADGSRAVASRSGAPDFRIGPNPGYVWTRITITKTPVGIENWDGSGNFATGETEDYLLYVADPEDAMYADYGDAPDGNIAYPSLGIIGNFPTCGTTSGEFIKHGNTSGRFEMSIAAEPSIEPSGNRGYCGILCNFDDDDGCLPSTLASYTIEGPPGSEVVVLALPRKYERYGSSRPSIGRPCQIVRWGRNFNILWHNNSTLGDAYLNVLIDWNQDGEWGGSVSCGEGLGDTDEHVLKNYITHDRGGDFSYDLEFNPELLPPDFRMGPNSGYVWVRYTITDAPVPLPWNGSGRFNDGETEDHLFLVQEDTLDFGDAPWEKYKTLEVDAGAVHRIVTGFCLGETVDADFDGLPDEDALGDDNFGVDDEDGVEFLDTLVPGTESTIVVTASSDGILNAWIDFNADSSWDDADEQIFSDTPLISGENELIFRTPERAELGSTFARFRFSDVSGLSYRESTILFGARTLPPNGEVEDYKVTIGGEKSVVKRYEKGLVPLDFELSQNIPNPFNPTTEIHFALPKTEHVSLSIYNLVGQELRAIVNEHKEAGQHVVVWDGKDKSGNILPTGIYIYKIKAGDFIQVKKLLLLK